MNRSKHFSFWCEDCYVHGKRSTRRLAKKQAKLHAKENPGHAACLGLVERVVVRAGKTI